MAKAAQEIIKAPEMTPAQIEEMNELYGTGVGISRRQEDNIIPLIYILQPLSPQAQSHRPDYIQGAVPGMIWLRNASNPLVAGNTGILFQPCFVWKDWGEWIPRERGGGMAGRWANKWDTNLGDDVPDCADAQSTVQDGGFPSWTRPNGNDLTLTRSHAGFVLLNGIPLPYVIPFTSSGLSISKGWMTRMGTKFKRDGTPADIWSVIYRLKTKAMHNAKGDWFAFDVHDTGEADGYPAIGNGIPTGFVHTRQDIERGKELHKAFAERKLQAEAPVAASGDMRDEIPF